MARTQMVPSPEGPAARDVKNLYPPQNANLLADFTSQASRTVILNNQLYDPVTRVTTYTAFAWAHHFAPGLGRTVV